MSGKEHRPVPAVQKAEPSKTLPNATLASENCAPQLGGFDFAEVEARPTDIAVPQAAKPTPDR
ncbi:MAG: hypothetical protein ACJAZO_003258, partial [Myxococcota bacterium]|jgi:hypothetical protein